MESKRLSFVLIVIASLLTVLITPAAVTGESPPVDSDLGWSLQTVDTFARINWLRDRSIAVDPSGRPHIAYGDGSLYLSWSDGARWQVEAVDVSPGAGYFTSLVIDAQGYEHISYNNDVSDDLKYAHRDAGGWHVETVDAEGSVGEFSSLALDDAGRPHIAY